MRVVLPGVDEVMASPLWRVSMLINDDLPTLERPMNAYSWRHSAGHLLTSELLISNFEDTISICCRFLQATSRVIAASGGLFIFIVCKVTKFYAIITITWQFMFNFVPVMGTNPNRETTFRFKQFAVRNGASAMKVGTDGVLLGAWCGVGGARRALDVGTGTGLIALMLAQRSAEVEVLALDVVEEAVEEARYNVEQSPWIGRIEVRCGDFNKWQSVVGDASPFDLVVSNPPFYKAQVKSPDYARRMARHGDGLDYKSLIGACRDGLLSADGRLAMILPAEFDADVIFEAEMSRMHVVRKVGVFTKSMSLSSSRTLWELSFDRSLPSDHGRLFIGSDDYRMLTEPFYL